MSDSKNDEKINSAIRRNYITSAHTTDTCTVYTCTLIVILLINVDYKLKKLQSKTSPEMHYHFTFLLKKAM